MTTHLRSRDPGPELPGLARTLDRAADHEFDLGAVRLGIDGLVVHRRRRRRQLTTALAAAAAVLVLGGSTWLLAPGRDLGTVATPVPPVTAAPTEPPVVVEPTTTEPPALPYELVPDDVVLTDAEIGDGVLQLQQDQSRYADIPVVMGQACNQGLPGAEPVGGRTLAWFDPALQQGGSVLVNVTVWADGTGGAAFAEAVGDTGRCRWLDRAPVVDDGPWDVGDRFVVQGEDVFGAAVYRAVARVGDVLVGVEVNDPRGEDQAQTDAQRIADLVVRRVVDSGMPAAR